jgi:hypothetical protein
VTEDVGVAGVLETIAGAPEGTSSCYFGKKTESILPMPTDEKVV